MQNILKFGIIAVLSLVGSVAFHSEPAQAYMKVCNRTGSTVRAAFAYGEQGIWRNRSWFYINDGACEVVYHPELWNRYYYFYAEALSGGYYWTGDMSFCVNSDYGKKTTVSTPINASQCSRGQKIIRMQEVDTHKTKDYVMNLR